MVKYVFVRNEIIKHNDCFELILESRGKKYSCFIDKPQINKVRKIRWNKDTAGYAISSEKMRMHSLIMGYRKGMVIDHINHNKLDNRKNNLRFVTKAQNQWNRKSKGVCFDKSRNNFRAIIVYLGKQITLGRFNKLNDAIKARKEAEIKYYGNYRYKKENS